MTFHEEKMLPSCALPMSIYNVTPTHSATSSPSSTGALDVVTIPSDPQVWSVWPSDFEEDVTTSCQPMSPVLTQIVYVCARADLGAPKG